MEMPVAMATLEGSCLSQVTQPGEFRPNYDRARNEDRDREGDGDEDGGEDVEVSSIICIM
jgi:hypothetical protein